MPLKITEAHLQMNEGGFRKILTDAKHNKEAVGSEDGEHLDLYEPGIEIMPKRLLEVTERDGNTSHH